MEALKAKGVQRLPEIMTGEEVRLEQLVSSRAGWSAPVCCRVSQWRCALFGLRASALWHRTRALKPV